MSDSAVDQLAPAATATIDEETSSLEVQDLLVEDVSIDGMCGVY